MNEYQVLDEAIEAIYRQTGLKVRVLKRDYVLEKMNREADALLEIGGTKTKLIAEIKKWATHANFGVILDQLRRLGTPDEVILVADYVNPRMADKLKEAGIQFLDTAGNAYINDTPVLVYIKGNKQQRQTKKPYMKTGRAFQYTGLKVVYEFLKDKELMNAPYRQIADRAGVALGNIGWVIGDLIHQGYIEEPIKGKEKKLVDFDGLLDKWTEEYPYKLREKLKLGTYAGDEKWLMEMEPYEFGALWGGEKAAEAYTKYLIPKDYVIYTHRRDLKDIITFGRLRKWDENKQVGLRVDIYDIFWKKQDRVTVEGCTDAIITYADLVATGDPRNLETAQRIREKLIH